jgi:hypothetical protein
VRLRWRPALVPGAITALILVVYSGLLVLRLPVPDRMLLTPAGMLSLFCGFAAVGWVGHRPGGLQRLWAVGGVALIGLLLATAPGEISRLNKLNNLGAGSQRAFADLRALNRSPAARSAFASCQRIWVGNLNLTQYVAYYLDRPLRTIGSSSPTTPQRGAYVAFRTPNAAYAVVGHWPKVSQLGIDVPPGVRRIAANRSWIVYANGC